MFNDHDPFDLALALYHWLQHNWNGQTDPLYAAFCELTSPGMYRPAISEQLFENIDGTALEVYETLTLDSYREALDLVLNYECVG